MNGNLAYRSSPCGIMLKDEKRLDMVCMCDLQVETKICFLYNSFARRSCFLQNSLYIANRTNLAVVQKLNFWRNYM